MKKCAVRKSRAREIEGRIVRIGGRGDGVLEGPEATYYVPYTVPGDEVSARIGPARGDGFSASLMTLTAAGPDRVDPPCPYFHDCGGCALQMLADGAYAEWKRQQVVAALARQDLADVVVEPLAMLAAQSRRRADLVMRRLQSATLLGFHERGGQRIIDIETCLVLRPEIVALLKPLRQIFGPLLAVGASADFKVTLTQAGLDIGVSADLALDADARAALAQFAAAHDLARLSLIEPRNGYLDVIVRRHAAVVEFSGVLVEMPPGGFIQACAEAEALMVSRALNALKNLRAVADLYAGLGAFTFAAAVAGHKVHAVEGDEAAVAALQDAARRAPAAASVTSEIRDLVRAPLMAAELNRFDAVIFDPPRAGAPAQAREIARSKIKIAVGVSCHPGSFARDARLLADGGFKLESVLPIDQFRWSPHVELIGVFRR
jgi:23S rRNA (uracil1939-C5)-methyltransferase